MIRFRICCLLLACLTATNALRADEATIAVAANFANTATDLVNRFEAASKHRIILVIGSTGKLAAQILHGAPYDALLAADQERPALLEEQGLTVKGSRFSYARGRLAVIASPQVSLGSDLPSGLLDPAVRHIALANEKLAPYGRAARQVLDRIDIAGRLTATLTVGESVGQVHGLVTSGNAQLGFVAFSQVDADDTKSAFIEVPASLHDPILQDAVLLARGQNNQAATGFIDFIKTPTARQAIVEQGYGAAP